MRDFYKMVYSVRLFLLFALLGGTSTVAAQDNTGKWIDYIEGDQIVFRDGTTQQLPGLQFDDVRLFILVRHAEKDTIGFDPGLTDAGNARADRLAQLFADVPIEAVYATPFRRTILTGHPLAMANGLEVVQYDQGHLDHFIEEVLWPGTGNMVIVGHTNTTPALINKILDADRHDKIPESEYQHIFILEKYPTGKVKEYRFAF